MITESGIAQYSMLPEEFAEIICQCAANGATLIGGCCGTDPEYISLLK